MPAIANQMNVRIDRDLKRRGDAGLRAIGLSPTQAIRKVWELASGSDEDRDNLQALLSSHGDHGSEDIWARRRRAAEDGGHLFERHLAGLGVTPDMLARVEPEPYSKERDRQTLTDALMEKYWPEESEQAEHLS